jgi:NitT/TauT family transport system substrate-binding protein
VNLRPYNHSLAPFLSDKTAAMQGFATAEPKRMAEATGREPRVFLLADHGWNSYSTVLETRTQLIEERPELVQRFIDASIAGWRNYLAGGKPAAVADELIKKENPAMTDGQIAFSRAKMRELQLLGPNEPSKIRIGAIDKESVGDFYKKMVAAGMYDADDVDPQDAVDTQFVD